MIENKKIIILGGGIAGLSCAEEIRKNSNDIEITLITAESNLPYYRLSLTRYLANEIKKDNLLIHPKSWYDDKKINIISGVEVTEIDKENKLVKLENGTNLNYDKLVLTTGASPFIPPIQGRELGNVVTLRNMKDTEFLLDKMQHIKSCICIGGGTLGIEVAGAIAKTGVKVLLLEGLEWLMPRQLNKKASGVLKDFLHKIGIEVKENIKIEEITGSENCNGVKLSSGEQMHAELIIVTAGVSPNIQLAKNAGLSVNKGLLINNSMKTSDEDIFAAGDVTEHNGVLYGLWNVAQLQGKVAAQNILGNNIQFEGVHKTNILKVLGLDMFSIGEFCPTDKNFCNYEKDTADGYICLILRNDKIIGANIIGNMALSMKVKQAVEKGLEFSEHEYNDINSILERLMKFL
jgi:nitrite reductase (NADH) large subunit